MGVLEVAVDERRQIGVQITPGRCEVGNLSVGRLVRLPHAVAAAGVGLEARHELVVKVVEDAGPLVLDLAVAVILDADEVVEVLVRLLEADDGIWLHSFHRGGHRHELLAETIRLPLAFARRMRMVLCPAGRKRAAYNLVHLDHLATELHER